jgi:hypothetical protein
MNTDDWKIQVSIKSSASKDADMINIRANTADELSVLLEGVSGYSTQIAATAKMVQAAYNTLPLATQSSTQDTTPKVSSVPDQARTASPTCMHGPRVFKSGISKKTGQPYAFWSCPQPMGADQCKPVN